MEFEREHWLRTAREKSQPIEISSEDGEVTLRQLTSGDAEELFQLITNSKEHLSQHGESVPRSYPSQSATEASITDPAVTLRHRLGIRNTDGVLVGLISLTLRSAYFGQGEVGYFLGKHHTGKGYATRAVRTLTDYAFTKLNYAEIHGVVAKTNLPSMRVLQRAGYTVKHRGESTIVFSKTRPLPKSTAQ